MYKPLHSALLSLAITLTPLSSTQALDTELPDLGNSAGNIISPQQERELGKAFMRSVRQSESVLDDPLVVDYIQSLGAKLVQNSSKAGQRFDFFVINNPEINAFAGPAGHIGVYTGLILTTQTESELAAVLAHEIAHVTQQHLLRAWETASDMTLPNAAVLLAAIALGVTVGADAGIAAATAGQAAALQQQINFTRANEQEADRIGIDLLAHSGYEPRAMPAFFTRMSKATRFYSSKVPEFLLTHPVTTSRISDSLGRATTYPYVQNDHDLRYQLVRLLLRHRTAPELLPDAAEYDRMLKEGRFHKRAVAEFGKALALLRADQATQARPLLQQLLNTYPNQPEFIVTLAQTEAKLGQVTKALDRLQHGLLAQPASYALNLAYAESALANGHAHQSLTQLRKFLAYRDQDPAVYKLLSRAAANDRHPLLAHEYQSLYHYTDGRTEQAIGQLEIALRDDQISFYQRTKFESRLKQWRKELKDQKERE